MSSHRTADYVLPRPRVETSHSLRPRLLLHACCGPCATSVIEKLRPHYRITVLWYNPNLEPPEEHDRRLETLQEVVAYFGVDVFSLRGSPEDWLEQMAGHECDPEGGDRCELCYLHRLRRAAEATRGYGFDYFATTLSLSPHKPTARVNAAGLQAAEEFGVTFLDQDFGREDGFRRSVELSRILGLYRQNYCGCLFSHRSAPGNSPDADAPAPEDQPSL